MTLRSVPLPKRTTPPYGDAEWVSRVQRRDEEAFDRLVEVYYPPLVAFARQHLGAAESARSVVQDVFLKIWRLGDRWQPRGSLRPYLYGAVHHQCIDQKKQARFRFVHVEADAESLVMPGVGPEDDLRYREMLGVVQRTVARMPERRRLAFVLSRSQGLSHAEIAAVLGIASGTVERHIGMALKTLRERLAAYL